MIKNLAKRLLIGLSLVLMVGLVAPPLTVEAAEPGCFFYGELTGGSEGASTLTCSANFLSEYSDLVPDFEGFEDDKCYLLSDLPSPSAREIDCAEALELVNGTGDVVVDEGDPEFESGGGFVASGACEVGDGGSVDQGKALQCIYERIAEVVFFLSLLIGAALLGSTIYAGIQYITAGADSGKVQKAKGRLASNIIVLVLFIFSASILNWILPGS